MTKMEDDQNGKRPKWKMTKMKDDQNGGRGKLRLTQSCNSARAREHRSRKGFIKSAEGFDENNASK